MCKVYKHIELEIWSAYVRNEASNILEDNI